MRGILLIALTIALFTTVAWAGMSDLERAGENAGVWTEMGRFINSTHNTECAMYRATVASLKADITDTTNAKLISEIGITNDISISIELTNEIRSIMLATEVFCKGADTATKILPANN